MSTGRGRRKEKKRKEEKKEERRDVREIQTHQPGSVGLPSRGLRLFPFHPIRSIEKKRERERVAIASVVSYRSTSKGESGERQKQEEGSMLGIMIVVALLEGERREREVES